VIGGVDSAVPTGTPGWPVCQRLNNPVTAFWHNVRMADENILTLRQADQARTDFALIESNLEFLAGQLARVPTRGDLAKAALGIIFGSCAAALRFGNAKRRRW
jgi:hypothetical protein